MSRERIKKLLGLTMANGCTEAEAMAAAAKAAKLMAELGLRLGDIELTQDVIRIGAGLGSARAKLWPTIASCTNTAPVTSYDERGKQIMVYVGREPGPEIATYLHFVTDRAITRELASFKTTTWYKRRRTVKAKRQAAADFTAGMVNRLRNRLRELFSSSLDHVQIEAAVAERDARFPHSKSVTIKPREHRYSEAAYVGSLAGTNVTLSHGVAAGLAPKQIGGA